MKTQMFKMPKVQMALRVSAGAYLLFLMSACGMFPDKTLQYVNAEPSPSVVLANGQVYPNAPRYEILGQSNKPSVIGASTEPQELEKFIAPAPPKPVVNEFVIDAVGTDILWSNVTSLQEDGNAQPVLAVNAIYEAVWVRLLDVLPEAKIEVNDKNFTEGLVFVELPSSYDAAEDEYQLNLERGANGALLVLKVDDKLADVTLSKQVLAVIESAIVQ